MVDQELNVPTGMPDEFNNMASAYQSGKINFGSFASLIWTNYSNSIQSISNGQPIISSYSGLYSSYLYGHIKTKQTEKQTIYEIYKVLFNLLFNSIHQ